MDLKENSRLINFYLEFLKNKKEERIKNYRENFWEQLSSEDQLFLALHHSQIEKEAELDRQINFNQILREYKSCKAQRKINRIKSASQ